MNSKHRQTLDDLFATPTRATIPFADVEALVKALGGDVKEGAGSRVSLRIGSAVKHAHRPHPGHAAKKYQVEEFRAWLSDQGITP